MSTYRDYYNTTGMYEISWYGVRFGACTGYYIASRFASFRLGPVQINPIELAASFDFDLNDIIYGRYFDRNVGMSIRPVCR
jgi:hypothetical protein